MKLFFLLTCCFTLSLSANSLAQQERVSLKMKNVGVEKLFDEVQRQTKLYFLFNIEQVKQLGKISLDVNNETVDWEPEEYAICLKKGNTELTEKMNAAIKELKEDGTLDKIMANYIGDDQGSYQYETPEGTEYTNGTLTMATNAEFEPWEYKEGDNIVGIDADMAKAICDKMGYDLKIDDMAFESILAAVSSGKAEFGAAGMTVTDERKESVDFTDTYANASQVVIVRK